MSRLFLRLMLVVGIGMTGAACLDDGYAAPRGYYQPALGYSNPYSQRLQQRLRSCSITVWLFAACAVLQPNWLYHGDRDEPRPEWVS